MRANPLVCFEVDEFTNHDQWTSVVVFGRYEELSDLPEYKSARDQALKLLQKRANWWEPACLAEEHRDTPHSCTPIPYRIHIDGMTGQQAAPDVVVKTVRIDEERRNRCFNFLGHIWSRQRNGVANLH